jgi:hypothetical protein
LKDAGSIQNLIQKDRVLAAVCLKIAFLYKIYCCRYVLHTLLWGQGRDVMLF